MFGRNEMAKEDEVREAAYYVWLNNGCPEGVEIDCWLEAEAQEGDCCCEEKTCCCEEKACCCEEDKEEKKPAKKAAAKKAAEPAEKKPAAKKAPAKKAAAKK